MMFVPGPCFENCWSKQNPAIRYLYFSLLKYERDIFGRNQSNVIIWQIHKLVNGLSQPVSGKLESHTKAGKQTEKEKKKEGRKGRKKERKKKIGIK